MNYENKSDFEINKLVYALEFVGQPQCNGEFIYHPTMCSEYDPCNNPRDSWPIILNNDITILFKSNGDCDVSFEYIREDTNEILMSWIGINKNEKDKILRSAMICYLMMKDKEDEI